MCALPPPLTPDPQTGRARESRRHDRGGTAVEGERRDQHPAVPDGHELSKPRGRLLLQDRDGIGTVRRGCPIPVGGPGDGGPGRSPSLGGLAGLQDGVGRAGRAGAAPMGLRIGMGGDSHRTSSAKGDLAEFGLAEIWRVAPWNCTGKFVEREMEDELTGKTIAIIATDGVEQVELTEPRKAVESAGASTLLLSPSTGEIQAMNSDIDPADTFTIDKAVSDASPEEYDGLILPG